MNATIQDYISINSLPYQENSVSLYCYGSKVYHITSPPDRFSIEMIQPTHGVAGLSVAYRDAYGWHVQQMQKQEHAIMNVSGESIDAACFVASYLYTDTPTGIIDFGSGNQRTVQILVYESEGATTPLPTRPTENLFEILTYGMSALVIIVLIVVVRKVRSRPS
ncbi:MAG: hypothetical protein ACXADC_15805 [Candidatus Thorarchaeota archaeon]